ncbi:MAG: hypothetical protein H7A43_12455 [Verrucomicrobia bacterium]|nr:hypothetical protein [Verrucomicrobiota bacterium]
MKVCSMDHFTIRVVDPSGSVLGLVAANADLDAVTLVTGGVHRIEMFYDGFASDPIRRHQQLPAMEGGGERATDDRGR